MKQIVAILLMAIAVTACGKKPGRMTPIVANGGQSQLSQPYPKVQTPPPVDLATP